MRIRNYMGAGVLLFRFNREDGEYEVLLGKRSIRQGYGKWAIPGGGLERYDSDYRACAYRELREETGIRLESLQHKNLDEIRTDIPFFHWRTFLVLIDEANLELRPREFSELRWVSLPEIKNMDLWINLNRELRAFCRIMDKTDAVIISE